jgi:hypothetical protein
MMMKWSKMEWRYDNPTYIDRDDCAIRSLAKLLDKPYIDVKADLLQLKWLNRIPRYYYMENIEKYIKRHKLREIKVKGVKVSDYTSMGHYLILVDGHLLTVINNVLYDNWDSRSQLVQRVWVKE